MTGHACQGGRWHTTNDFYWSAATERRIHQKSKMLDENSTIFRWKGTGLFFEEIFESLSGVGRTAGYGLRKSGGDLRGLLIRRGSGVFFDGGAELVELAVVFAVLGSDAFENGLRTLKLRAGIEEAALFAAMKFGIALGTSAAGIEAGREDGTTIGATSAGDRADHARRARAEMIVLSARTALGRLAFGAGLLFFVAIAVAAMAVLTIHRYLRALALRQCERKEFALRQTCTS